MLKCKWINLTIFWVESAFLLLQHSENLSATLQSRKLSASQAQSIARETVITLEKLRDHEYFLLLWKEVLTESNQLNIDEPTLGRKRKASRQIENVIVALQLVSFIKNSRIFPGKFTLKYWIYLLMQSKIDSYKGIRNARSYKKIYYENVLKTKVMRMSLKPFSATFQNSSETTSASTGTIFHCMSLSQRQPLSIITWCSKTAEYRWKGNYLPGNSVI